ncbi:Hypothetical protein HVR_LOCUS853 [uncultured virus]|nr:Hypothetical protein HVR_LOCUS853 [uncultured virus]
MTHRNKHGKFSDSQIANKLREAGFTERSSVSLPDKRKSKHDKKSKCDKHGKSRCAVKVGNTIFVDAEFGNDRTAMTACSSLPFKTINAAIRAIPLDAPLDRWVVHIRPGTYREIVTIDRSVHMVGGPAASVVVIGGFNISKPVKLTSFTLTATIPNAFRIISEDLFCCPSVINDVDINVSAAPTVGWPVVKIMGTAAADGDVTNVTFNNCKISADRVIGETPGATTLVDVSGVNAVFRNVSIGVTIEGIVENNIRLLSAAAGRVELLGGNMNTSFGDGGGGILDFMSVANDGHLRLVNHVCQHFADAGPVPPFPINYVHVGSAGGGTDRVTSSHSSYFAPEHATLADVQNPNADVQFISLALGDSKIHRIKGFHQAVKRMTINNAGTVNLSGGLGASIKTTPAGGTYIALHDDYTIVSKGADVQLPALEPGEHLHGKIFNISNAAGGPILVDGGGTGFPVALGPGGYLLVQAENGIWNVIAHVEGIPVPPQN